jgi:vacuolar protein 8
LPATVLALFRHQEPLLISHAEKYQVEIVKADGLSSLLRLLQSSYLPLILSSAACVRNVSIHPLNESPIIESGFLQPLINLLSFKDNEEVQCHAISTLRNLAASSEKNKTAIVNAGAVQSIKQLVLEVPMNVQSEMTACIAVLALSGMSEPFSFSTVWHSNSVLAQMN